MNERVHTNPSGLWPHAGFPMNHGVVEPAGRRVHITGQVAWDENGHVQHKGDADAQTRYALGRVAMILGSLGGTLSDIVSMTTYYVNQTDYDAINSARRDMFEGCPGFATTGIRVAGLVSPDLLVELTPIAIIPEERFKEPD